MQKFRLEKLSTTELIDIRDYIQVLLKDRVPDERRKIRNTLARIEEAALSDPTLDHILVRNSGMPADRTGAKLARSVRAGRYQKTRPDPTDPAPQTG